MYGRTQTPHRSDKMAAERRARSEAIRQGDLFGQMQMLSGDFQFRPFQGSFSKSLGPEANPMGRLEKNGAARAEQ